MKRPALVPTRAALTVAAVAVLTACASNSAAFTSSSDREGTTKGVTCPDVIPASPTMVSPTNGATGVADGNFSLVLTSSAYAIEVKAPGGATVALPAPSPAPSSSPAPSDETFAVPALQPATTYAVVGLFDAGNSCEITTSIGTFTTQ